jgi:predicted nucleic acid-binding protein
MADLVEIYADFPLGTTDASVIAVAERLHITEIATLDRRHFAAVRPAHCKALTLLP